MPIGSSLVDPDGFCSEHSKKGKDLQPDAILQKIRPLTMREGSVDLGDRHKCPYCAYIRGYLDALETVQKDVGRTLTEARRNL